MPLHLSPCHKSTQEKHAHELAELSERLGRTRVVAKYSKAVFELRALERRLAQQQRYKESAEVQAEAELMVGRGAEGIVVIDTATAGVQNHSSP